MNILSNIQNNIASWVGDPILLILRLAAILLALGMHECAHAYAADRAGDPTAKSLGRKTLNPLKHIDPVGFICLIFLGFGWAKPVPINPNNFRDRKKDTLKVSLAGVATNLVMAFLGVFFYVLVLRISVSTNGAGAMFIQYATSFFSMLAVINLSFMIFNLLPIPPLDGWQALKTLLLGRANLNWLWNYERYGQLIMIVLLVTGIIGRILSPLVSGIFNGFMSLWLWIFF